MENLNERLKQAKLDKASVEENIKDLEKQIEEAKTPKPRHGDIVTTGWDGGRIVVWNQYGKRFYACGKMDFNGNLKGHAGVNEESIPNLYKTGAYQVVGNIFDGDKWNG